LAKLKTYVAGRGETLTSISTKLNVSKKKLESLNPALKNKKLRKGSKVLLPSGKKVSKTKEPKKNSKITYTITETDNDWVIARKLGIQLSVLHKLNPGVNWNRLAPGKKIYIPSSSSEQESPARSTRIASRYVKIEKDNVLVRVQPNAGSTKLTMVEQGAVATVLDRSGSWYKLRLKTNEEGWVRRDMLAPMRSTAVLAQKSSHKSLRRHRRAEKLVAQRSSKRRKSKYLACISGEQCGTGAHSVVESARAYLGVRYRWTGMSRSGFDCSGLTSHVYRKYGVRLPHSSRAQARVGRGVSKSELRPGDLVLFRTNRGNRINHVGIYAGNGKFIHASSGGGRVQVDSLNSGYYARRYAGARRVKNMKSSSSKYFQEKSKEAENNEKKDEKN
jgi:LysM repeat protein